MSSPEPARRSLLVIVPLVAFVALAGLFFVRLRSGADPSAIPSALIGRAAPAFDLAALPGLAPNGASLPGGASLPSGASLPGLSSADLKGRVTLVNFWASWCAPCQIEHPQLMRLAREPGLRLVGIAYKDAPENARRFLSRNGVPFQAVGMDSTGRTAIDFGVYGVPESFIIGPDGTIRDKLVGIVTPENYKAVLDKIRAAGAVADAAP